MARRAAAARRHARPRAPSASHWHDRLAQVCCSPVARCWSLFLLAPLAAILVEERAGQGRRVRRPAAVREYFATPALRSSIWNTFWVRIVVTGITIPLAFAYAYALTRSAACAAKSTVSRDRA